MALCIIHTDCLWMKSGETNKEIVLILTIVPDGNMDNRSGNKMKEFQHKETQNTKEGIAVNH